MTERELFEAIGHVDDDLILAADAPVKKRRRVVHLHWQQVVSVAACACIVLGGAAVWRSGTLRKSSIAGEAAMAADVPEAAAETAPAPDMPMLDAAAPQAAIDRISRMKPRIMASSPEISITDSKMMSSSVMRLVLPTNW